MMCQLRNLEKKEEELQACNCQVEQAREWKQHQLEQDRCGHSYRLQKHTNGPTEEGKMKMGS